MGGWNRLCSPSPPAPGARPAPAGRTAWSLVTEWGTLGSSAVGDEEIRFVPSGKRMRRLRSHGQRLLTKEFRLGLNRHRSLKAPALTGWEEVGNVLKEVFLVKKQ